MKFFKSNSPDHEAKRQAAKEALGVVPPDAPARKQRGKDLRDAVVDPRRLRDPSPRSETVISFRGSQALKDRLAKRRSNMRAKGEKFNQWMERIIQAALDAEERGR